MQKVFKKLFKQRNTKILGLGTGQASYPSLKKLFSLAQNFVNPLLPRSEQQLPQEPLIFLKAASS